jgi:hypothetical protein
VNKAKKSKEQEEPEKSQYEQQLELKKRFKSMLENEQLIPRVRKDGHFNMSQADLLGVDLPDAVSADDASQ